MTLREFFTGRAIVFSLLLIIGFVIFGYKTYFSTTKNTEVSPTPIQENIEPPIFIWRYEKDDSLNLDGLPQTNVYLEASYSGKKISKLIITVPGGCNDLPEKEKDSVPHSSVAQCYAAGYGDLFKVIKGDHSYLVMHKVFEEGSPDSIPPAQQYEVVSEFPFNN